MGASSLSCGVAGEYSLGHPGERREWQLPVGDTMANEFVPSEEEVERLRARLAQIQVERAAVIRAWDFDDVGETSDALHDLAKEESQIRRTLGLPPNEWEPDSWPWWGGWLVLTLTVVGIVFLAWLTGQT